MLTCPCYVLMKDRLVLGSNSTYLFIGFPSERSGEDWSRYDYDYFQSELAEAEGFHIQSLCEDQGHRTCGFKSIEIFFFIRYL